MPAFRRHTLSKALGIAAFAAAAAATTALAQPAAPASAPTVAPHMPPRMTAPEFHLGDPKAKVTVIEYASDTCSHCAKFAAEVFPAFKAKYVDTGKVLYIFREFPTDPVELSAAGFLVARCAGQDRYFDVVTTLLHSQKAATGKDFLMAGAKAGGLDEEQMKTCLNDPTSLTDLNARVQTAINVEKIEGTPTFIVNGKKLEDGEKTMKELDAAIGPLLGPTKANAAPKRRRS